MPISVQTLRTHMVAAAASYHENMKCGRLSRIWDLTQKRTANLCDHWVTEGWSRLQSLIQASAGQHSSRWCHFSVRSICLSPSHKLDGVSKVSIFGVVLSQRRHQVLRRLHFRQIWMSVPIHGMLCRMCLRAAWLGHDTFMSLVQGAGTPWCCSGREPGQSRIFHLRNKVSRVVDICKSTDPALLNGCSPAGFNGRLVHARVQTSRRFGGCALFTFGRLAECRTASIVAWMRRTQLHCHSWPVFQVQWRNCSTC